MGDHRIWVRYLTGDFKGRIKLANAEDAERYIRYGTAERCTLDDQGKPIETEPPKRYKYDWAGDFDHDHD